jgi:hypothetical protein
VYSTQLEESLLAFAAPETPSDGVRRVDERAGSVAENLAGHRARLEKTMRSIERSTNALENRSAFMETDGMFTAGKTKTGVGVLDLFAKDPRGEGPRDGLARMANARAGRDETKKWFTPSAAKRGDEETQALPEETPSFIRVITSVFGCGCGGR